MANLADFIEDITRRFPIDWNVEHLSADQLLAVWWIFSQATDENIAEAKASLTGAAGDGGVDAVRIEAATKMVYIVQSKLRSKHDRLENEADLARLSRWQGLVDGPETEFDDALSGLNPTTQEALRQARLARQRDRFRVVCQFVTTGHASPLAIRHQPVSFQLFNGYQIIRLYEDFKAGVRPIPELKLKVAPNSAASATSGGIGLAVYLVPGDEIHRAVAAHRDRLFARNVRGFLGTTGAVNAAIVKTVRTEPQRFRYMNNGLTIVCDSAPVTRDGDRYTLKLVNPQVVNGQQTSRSIGSVAASQARRVQVITKVVAIDRSQIDEPTYDRMVREIVEATNLQTKIALSDLRSNDKRQVELGRALRRLGHYYARKTESMGTYRLKAAGNPIVLRRLLADAVGGCLYESLPHRMNKDALYDDPYYEQVFDAEQATRNLVAHYLWKAVRERSNPWNVSQVRAQGKWLVLYALWVDFEAILMEGSTPFIRHGTSLQPNAEVTRRLGDAIDGAGAAVEAYYAREWRRRIPEDDPVRFFKFANLYPGLTTYMATARGQTYRRRLDRAARGLRDALH